MNSFKVYYRKIAQWFYCEKDSFKSVVESSKSDVQTQKAGMFAEKDSDFGQDTPGWFPCAFPNSLLAPQPFHLGSSCQPPLYRAPSSLDRHSIVLPPGLCPLDLSCIALTLDIK